MFSAIYNFFDKLEDKIRNTLSHHVFVYTFIGGTGLVLFWRGIWHMADVLEKIDGWPSLIFSPLGSATTGVIILLATGLFVSVFIGDQIILSGIRKDKKIIDKTIDEVETEKTEVEETLALVLSLRAQLDALEHKIRTAKPKVLRNKVS